MAINYEGKLGDLSDDYDIEALNQKVSMKMTRLLKKSSRTRPELTKALGVPSKLKKSFTYFADFLLVMGHLKLVVLSLPSHKYAFD